MTFAYRSRHLAWLVLCLLASAAVAQVRQPPNAGALPGQSQQPQPLRIVDPNAKPSRNVPFRTLLPFPVALPGFGDITPGALNQILLPPGGTDTNSADTNSAVTSNDPNAWPAWIVADPAIAAAEGFLPDRAILARSSERVWYLAPNAGAFVPLAFHDKIRLVTAGCQVEVRGRGEFQLLFHGGGTLRSRERISLRVDSLSETLIELTLERYSNVWLTARDRVIRLHLGSGETVEIDKTPAFLSSDGHLGYIKNPGRGLVTVEGLSGSVRVPSAHRIEVLAESRSSGFSGELGVVGDIASEIEGRILRAEGGVGGGSVVWNGARFAVSSGAVLRIDALSGDSFPKNRLEY